jgi:predicted DNA-binding transcriptional regulator AlpA
MKRRPTSTRNKSTPSTSVTPPVDDQLLPISDVLKRTSFKHRSTIWRLVRAGHFPAPIRIGAGRNAWRLSRVLQWQTDRELHPMPPRAYFGRGLSTYMRSTGHSKHSESPAALAGGAGSKRVTARQHECTTRKS